MPEKLDKFWQWIFIAIAVVVGLYFRIIGPWNGTFVDWMDGARLSGNDPWYYFRLIQSCLANFPNRIWFDAFTNYPYGTYTHFGPFLVYFSAIIAKLIGASNSESIRNVIVFIPAIGGALLALPVYLFAKEVFNKKTGVIASLLVIMIPGQLLHRSVLSFNDHHVWEVFWMTSTLCLFTLSINCFENIRTVEDLVNKKTKLCLLVLAGLALGLYLLAWAAGFVTALMILLFIFILYLLKGFIKVNTFAITTISCVVFLSAAFIYLPFAFKAPGYATMFYTPLQLIVLLASTLTVALFYSVEIYERKINITTRFKKYSITVAVTIIAIMLSSGILVFFPDFANQIIGIIGIFQPKGGALTIAEVQPFFIQGGQFSLANAWYHFSMAFFFAIPGMFYTVYLLIKERKGLYLLVLIWGFAMLVALAGQNRFAYYFGAVAAVFAAVMLDALLRRFRFYDAVNSVITNNSKELKKIGYGKIVISALLIFILFYPTFVTAYEQSKYAAGGINKQWYDALVWMRHNTPNKEMYDEFYYKLYQPSPNTRELYPYYPNGTYGIMSWWDYGHWITAIAHRIPNANPFQQGIGNKYNNVPGAAPFFTAFNESYANEIADKLGVKYVITDVEMATGKFFAMAVWAEGSLDKAGQMYYAGRGIAYITADGRLGIARDRWTLPPNAIQAFGFDIPSVNYYRTMEAKFHILDGSGLKNYRMVYESGFTSQNSWTGLNEILYRLIYNSNFGKFGKINVTSTGYVKIFEYVKGAKITGKVPENVSSVTITTTVKTNQNRTFVYKQIVSVENGSYEFIVPYAQETKYPVKPTPYTITARNVTKTISLTDEDIETGKSFMLDFV